MDASTRKRLSPALVIAMIALFVALGGTAGAIGNAAVPLAKRALLADKAKVATTAKLANTAPLATKAKIATTATTAITASNANALGGQSAAQILATATTAAVNAAVAQSPPGARPASTAAGLVQVKSAPVTLDPGEESGFIVSCNPLRAAHGGFSTNDEIVEFDSFPANNGSGWGIYLLNDDVTNPSSGIVHVTCIG
jgi:hypothetical protein